MSSASVVSSPPLWEATRDRDIVVLATDSPSPVIDHSWLAPGTHVTTVGPERQAASEFGMDLVEAASVVVRTLLPGATACVQPAEMVATSQHAHRVLQLGAVVASTAPGRQHNSGVWRSTSPSASQAPRSTPCTKL